MSVNSVHSPYKLEWLDSCLQETLLPGSPWTKVHACTLLAFVVSFFKLQNYC